MYHLHYAFLSEANQHCKSQLDPFTGVIDAIPKSDEDKPRKQRHTAKRIFERIQEEHGYSGGYTIVKGYVREKRLRYLEIFVPLSHPPGHGQTDFGKALAVIGNSGTACGTIERSFNKIQTEV